MSKYAKKTDTNHMLVVNALRKFGVFVVDTSRVGAGFPDLLCVYRGVTVLLEVKDGTRPRSERKLTPAQQRFHERFPGRVAVAESPEDAIRIVTGQETGRAA